MERELREINDSEVVKELHRWRAPRCERYKTWSMIAAMIRRWLFRIGAAGGIGFGVAAGVTVLTSGAFILVPVLAGGAVATIALKGGRMNQEGALVA